MTEVRRKDYEHSDRDDMLAFLDAAAHGFLSFVRPDGSPGLVALNFARIEDTIYFRGAPDGEKMRSLQRDPRVTFMVADGFSLVPSYFRDPERACPATQYYKAVVVHGSARIVNAREEKASALQAIMEKLQPEGGYRPITASDRFYRKSIDTTAVVALPIVEMTAKFKFGQNLPKRKRALVADQLIVRGASRDAETAAAMRAAKPF
jgi:nitroimidazol reductase NimA-like FMN-containing flavoprotein (pyridoxamine 5'-phosphate oxidase superfamily)